MTELDPRKQQREGAPYELNQTIRESSSSFLSFVERCARIYGGDEQESFDDIIEKLHRPSRFGVNKIAELCREKAYPIIYLRGENEKIDCITVAGKGVFKNYTPGWYFWDREWTQLQGGPYDTDTKALEELKKYEQGQS